MYQVKQGLIHFNFCTMRDGYGGHDQAELGQNVFNLKSELILTLTVKTFFVGVKMPVPYADGIKKTE